jgi:hypothetical protein
MDWSILLLSALTALFAAVYVLRPILQPDGSEVSATLDAEFRNLLDQKERCVQVLRDLELDFGTGKIEPEEFERMKSGIVSEMAVVLKQLDRYTDEQP